MASLNGLIIWLCVWSIRLTYGDIVMMNEKPLEANKDYLRVAFKPFYKNWGYCTGALIATIYTCWFLGILDYTWELDVHLVMRCILFGGIFSVVKCYRTYDEMMLRMLMRALLRQMTIPQLFHHSVYCASDADELSIEPVWCPPVPASTARKIGRAHV